MKQWMEGSAADYQHYVLEMCAFHVFWPTPAMLFVGRIFFVAWNFTLYIFKTWTKRTVLFGQFLVIFFFLFRDSLSIYLQFGSILFVK